MTSWCTCSKNKCGCTAETFCWALLLPWGSTRLSDMSTKQLQRLGKPDILWWGVPAWGKQADAVYQAANLLIMDQYTHRAQVSLHFLNLAWWSGALCTCLSYMHKLRALLVDKKTHKNKTSAEREGGGGQGRLRLYLEPHDVFVSEGSGEQQQC